MKAQRKALTVLLTVVVVGALCVGPLSAFGLQAPVFGDALLMQGSEAPRDVAVADFNEDGLDDVISAIPASGASPSGVALSLGHAETVLSEPTMIGVGGPTWSVVAGDFNKDDHMDVAASLAEAPGVVVMLGVSDGTFGEAVTYMTDNAVRGIAIADMNADGWSDIVGAEPDSGGVVVLTGENGGFCVSEHVVPRATGVLELAVGQLAGEKLIDLVLVGDDTERALVLENTGSGFETAAELAAGDQVSGAAVADFNGDGADDIALSGSTTADVMVFLANSAGGFAEPITTPTGDAAGAAVIETVDLDGDGDADLLVASSGALVAFENDGSGVMSAVETTLVASGATALAFGNPDGDKVHDIVMADYAAGCVRVIPSAQSTASVSTYRLPLPVPNTLDTIRVEGPTRYETAVQASALAFDGTDHVVIASGENWPDAVTASALAGLLRAPLLLTYKDTLPEVTANEIWRLGAADAVVIGGEAAVSESVITALKPLVGTGIVTRIGGRDRYETADLVAREVITLAGEAYDGRAFVATGLTFADALAASPLANAAGIPVFLTPPDGRNDLVDEMLGNAVADVVILGGAQAVGADVEAQLVSTFGADKVERVAGANRYETAALVAALGVSRGGLHWNGVGIATGIDFPDALAGGTMLGTRGSVMLLSSPDTLAVAANAALSTHADEIDTLVFIGSAKALGIATREAATSALR